MTQTLQNPQPNRVPLLAVIIEVIAGTLIPFAGLAIAIVLSATLLRGRWRWCSLLIGIGLLQAYVFVSGIGWLGVQYHH